MRLIPAPLRLAIACLLLPLVSRGGLLAEELPGTQPLTEQADFASEMIDGIDRFLLRETERYQKSPDHAEFWRLKKSDPKAYAEALGPARERLKYILGVVDERVPVTALEYVSDTDHPAMVGRGAEYFVYAVRWPVLPGIDAEGLLLTPRLQFPLADVIVVPDADQTPEQLAGLSPGLKEEQQIARRMAENRMRVLVPVLIDRSDEFSVTRAGRATNQTHREFVYRPAFEMGRHIIGYEVQKILAAVDFFQKDRKGHVGVFGYGEGGLLALCAAACDERIEACGVSGYFAPRGNLWQEPIYRNVFGLLQDFGDARLAAMVAPRSLIVEACRGPEIAGPPKVREGRKGAAPGKLNTPPLADVQAEFEAAQALVSALEPAPNFRLMVSGEDGAGPLGMPTTIQAFIQAMIPSLDLAPLQNPPLVMVRDNDPRPRLKRQFDQLCEHTQHLMRISPKPRAELFQDTDTSSLAKWEESTFPLREYFYDEVIGRIDHPLLPPNARTRQVFDEAKFRGYEVVLDVFPDVIAYGLLLVPKDVKKGERRPVVVCQHGLEGRPQDVADPGVNHRAYHQYGIRLAERGFVVYAPQNPYIFQDRFRTLQRKANPLGRSLFSIITPQHKQTLGWLSSLDFVDGKRIGFYGLSYGGKTAMRVPALLPEYALSICSADFNEWIWKNASLDAPYSYVGTGEYEIFEFNLGNTFNYAEMAALIAPRPFMVERGHHDGVAPDEWVAYEFAKVRRTYAALGIPERTEIEFFDGPHMINGVGTFDFLHRHLQWPAPSAANSSASSE